MSEQSSALIVATVGADGTPPTHRIGSAQALWSAYQDARIVNSRSDLRFADLRGCYDGFPPVPPSELEAQGLVDAPNINLKQMKAKITTYVSTWVDHNTGGDQWYDVKLKMKYFQSAQEWNQASILASRFFNDAIKEWDAEGLCNASQYIYESMVRDNQMGLFGIGVAYFPDPIDWRWQAVPTRKVLVPEGTKITLSNCPAMFIELPMMVTELYDYAREKDPDGPKLETPWNRKAILKVLYDKTAEKRGTTGMFETYSEWENRVRNNDTFLDHNFTPIQVVHGYVQEFTTYREKNGISHYIILQDGIAENEYLYENNREYESFQQAMVTFCDNAGPEGEWHGVKGFGDDIYDGCHFNNLMFNALALGAQMTTMPMFQAASEADRQKLNQVVFSRLGILYPDLQISQFKFNLDLQGGMAMLGESNRVMNTNTRIFPQNDTDRRGGNPTATQVVADRQDQTQFTSGQIKLYRITGADRLGYTMYYRLSRPAAKYPEGWPGGKAAAEFRKKCKEAGIPPEAYGDPLSVQASRTGGSGSMAIDSQKADAALTVATPGAGQMAARKEKIAALYGRERVAEFIQEEAPVTQEDVIVGLENAVLQDGKIVSAYPQQPPEIHLGEPTLEGRGHLAVAMAAQQAAAGFQEDEAMMMQNLEDAKKLNKVIEACFTHIGMHAQFMAQVPIYQDVIQGLGQFLKQLQTFHASYGKDVAKAMQASQPQGQQNPEMMKAMMKAQADAQALMMRTQAEIQSNWAKTQAKIEQQAATSESRHRIKEAEASFNLGVKAQQALVDTQIEIASTTAKRNAEMAKEKSE
jgi:hypothetical protein